MTTKKIKRNRHNQICTYPPEIGIFKKISMNNQENCTELLKVIVQHSKTNLKF
jgi:hypothetical protein